MRIQHRFALLGVAAMLASSACSSNANRAPVNEPSSPATTSGAAVPDASDRTACMKSCQGMEESLPLGSGRISQRESCTARCASKYDSR